MKIFRLLIYEGEEEMLDKQLAQCFVSPGRPFTLRGPVSNSITIKEVFRGRQEDPVVEYFEQKGE